MRILQITLFWILVPFLAIAQNVTKGWEAHFSYAHIVDLDVKENLVYAASENAVFIYNIYSGEIETLTTIDGLEGETITSIGYFETQNKLLIGYNNGLLQLVELNDKEVSSYVDIVEKHSIQADKKAINHIRFEGNWAYISTDYGISLFNLSRQEFGDTYYIGSLGSHLEVRETELFEGQIYAATSMGIKRAEASSTNLIDHNQWNTHQSGDYKAVQAIDGELYTWKGSKEIQKLINDGFVTIHNTNYDIIAFRASKTNLVLTTWSQAYAYTSDFVLESQMYIGNEYSTHYTIGMAEDGMFFQGTAEAGVLHRGFTSGKNLQILPEGPMYNSVFTVDAHNGAVWVAYGDVTFGYNPYPLVQRGISSLQNEYWTNIPFDEIFDANDLVRVKINKKNPEEVYFTSHHKGLLKVIGDKPVKLFDHSNSVLELPNGSTSQGVRLFGMDFDSDQNLWFVQTKARYGLNRLSPSGTISRIDLDGVLPYDKELALTELVVSSNGNIFFGTAHNGMIGYNPQTKKFNRIRAGSQGGLPNGYVRALALDLQDRLWIGTSNGLRIYQNTAGFFNTSNPTARQVIIMDGDVPQELLFEISINAIEVDGANNKWIATSSSGVFYVSSTGQETIYHFTKDNSPLPSNDVQDVAVDAETGKVYFATSKGLISFQGSATSARQDLNNLHAFPNPVRPEYHGEVTISGLMANTNVKITDLEGNLVFETTSQGGTVQWDTRAFGKYKVASGVYFVMANAKEGEVTKVAKIMIVR